MTARRLHRRHVHPPAARGRGPRRPGRRARRTAPTSSTGSPDELTEALLARRDGAPRRRRSRGPRRPRPPRRRGRLRAHRPGRPCVRLDAPDRVPDLVHALAAAGARVTRVEPHEPTLEDLYFAVRQALRRTAASARSTGAPSDGHRRRRPQAPTAAAAGPTSARSPAPTSSSSPGPRTTGSRCSSSGGIFFVFVPTVLLFTITQIGNINAVDQLSQALEILPEKAQDADQGRHRAAGRAGYALAVYLFAPVAVVVPHHHLHRGRRRHHRRRARARHRRVPRPLPRRHPRDLPRQADRQPAPRLPDDDRRLRRVLADRQHDRRARRRRLVLPHQRSGGC